MRRDFAQQWWTRPAAQIVGSIAVALAAVGLAAVVTGCAVNGGPGPQLGAASGRTTGSTPKTRNYSTS